MGKGIEFIGEVEEAWIPSSVFGSDTLAVDPKPILTFTLCRIDKKSKQILVFGKFY